MKSLFLLRHAKSSWADPALSDQDRPLNKRGRRDAPRMGAALGRRFAPVVFHVSTARRAQLTFEGLKAGWEGLTDEYRQTDSALYTFDADDLMGWLAGQGHVGDRLAIIGHNPALTDLVNGLVGQGTLDNLPTAGWLELSLPVRTWADCPGLEGNATLDFSLFPRELNHAHEP